MTPDLKPALLFVGNPQTSKNEALPQTDLLRNPTFARVVREFDQALGLSDAGSLHPDRQIASVVMSVAAHAAFRDGLNNMIQPGLIDQTNSKYKTCYTGHSVGEMGAFIEAGVCDIPTMAWMLNEREKITQDPARAGFRHLVAIVGADPEKLEANLGQIRDQLGEGYEFFVANFNSPKQSVVGLKIPGEISQGLEHVKGKVTEATDHAGALIFPRPPKVFYLLANGFHTLLMLAEERIYIPIIAPRLNSEYLSPPAEETVYSPTLPGWVNTEEESIDVIGHILTKPVQFTKAAEVFRRKKGLVAIVTADILGTMPKLMKDNHMEHQVLNITDLDSLDHSVEKAGGLILSYRGDLV